MLADAEPLVVVSVATHGGYSFADVLPRLLPPSVRRLVSFETSAWHVPGTSGSVPDPLDGGEIAAIASGTTGIPKASW